jgi:predicted kinase
MSVQQKMDDSPAIFVITGIMASGKSTVAQLLAERFQRGVHVRGDIFRRMIVAGREEMTPDAAEEALKQLTLRYKLAAMTADAYFEAGFNVVVQDNFIGKALQDFIDMIHSRPLFVVALCPRPEVVAAREEARRKKGYGEWTITTFSPRPGIWPNTHPSTATSFT